MLENIKIGDRESDEIMETKSTAIMQLTNILGYDNFGNLCQLWYCQNTGQKEWREIGFIKDMDI